MIRWHKMISSFFGIGYIGKGAGTIAAAVCCLCWWLIPAFRNGYGFALMASILIVIVGIWSAGKVESVWGKDHQQVVIDEVAGMCLSLLWIPVYPKYILAAFLLFRFFDIVKPLFIRRLELLPGGWGVMLDDLLAGLYANIVLQLMIATNLF